VLGSVGVARGDTLSQNEKLVSIFQHLTTSIPGLPPTLDLESVGRNAGTETTMRFRFHLRKARKFDLCFSLAFTDRDPNGWTGAYRTIIGNDEHHFMHRRSDFIWTVKSVTN